jgi:hypothetical protein
VLGTSPTITTPTISSLSSAAATALTLQSAGTTAITVDTSQNVGIGTASPSFKLDVSSSATETYSRIMNTSGSGQSILILNNNSGNWQVKCFTDNTFKIRDNSNSADRMIIDTSGNLQFNSGYGSAATAYGCRAWVNFNGTGTIAIRASGNVSSLTDNGVGDYTVNFTTSMPDANYSLVGASVKGGGAPSATNSALVTMGESPSTSGTGFGVILGNGSAANRNIGYVAVFR